MLRRSGWLACLMVCLTLMTGCANEQAGSAPPPAPEPTAPAPADPSPQPSGPLTGPELREQALALMSKGDYEGAIGRWTELVALEPTADNWNELSHANLLAKRWDEAKAAGQKALALKQDHPFALYNTGMALLEGGDYCRALYYLHHTALLQKGRFEPLVGLARAYLADGRVAPAQYLAEQAEAMGSTEARAVKEEAERLRRGAAPSDLETASVIKHTDGPAALYLYPESANGCDGKRYTLYAVRAGGGVSRLPVGSLGNPAPDLQRVTLSTDVTGYWLRVPREVFSHVSGAVQWRLIILKEGQLGQILFFPDQVRGNSPLEVDWVAAAGQPSLKGNMLYAAYRDSASGTQIVEDTWRLFADMQTAAHAGTARRLEGQLTRVGPTITVIARNRLDVLQEQYPYTFALEGAELRQQGRVIAPSDLRPGMEVSLTLAGQQLQRLEVLSH